MKTLPCACLIVLGVLLSGWSQAQTTAVKAKKVIVVSVTTGFRHDSIETGEQVLKEMAAQAGTFTVSDWVQQPTIKVSAKPTAPKPPGEDADAAAKAQFDEKTAAYQKELAKVETERSAFDEQLKTALLKLAPDYLEKNGIDGVIFVSPTGRLPLPDPQGFVDWVAKGHAFIGMHAATDTLQDFKPYIAMIGGEFDGHPWTRKVTVKVEDSTHPAAGGYTGNFEINDEIYQFKDWDRSRLHVILSLDPSNGDDFFKLGKRADKDYAVSWVRNEGKGRVFYTSLGHRKEVWKDAMVQKHMLGGIEWALNLR